MKKRSIIIIGVIIVLSVIFGIIALKDNDKLELTEQQHNNNNKEDLSQEIEHWEENKISDKIKTFNKKNIEINLINTGDTTEVVWSKDKSFLVFTRRYNESERGFYYRVGEESDVMLNELYGNLFHIRLLYNDHYMTIKMGNDRNYNLYIYDTTNFVLVHQFENVVQLMENNDNSSLALVINSNSEENGKNELYKYNFNKNEKILIDESKDYNFSINKYEKDEIIYERKYISSTKTETYKANDYKKQLMSVRGDTINENSNGSQSKEIDENPIKHSEILYQDNKYTLVKYELEESRNDIKMKINHPYMIDSIYEIDNENFNNLIYKNRYIILDVFTSDKYKNSISKDYNLIQSEYLIGNLNDKILSILFEFEFFKDEDFKFRTYVSLNYDLLSNKSISMEDMFQDNNSYVQVIKENVKDSKLDEILTETENSMVDFFVKNGSMTVFKVDHNKVNTDKYFQKVEFDLKNISDYLKY